MTPATDLLAQARQGRYLVDTSEIYECVDLPVSTIVEDKLIPEGQFRPLTLLVYVDTISPSAPAARELIFSYDKFLPGHLIDITDLITPFIVDPLVPFEISIGFSVIIQQNETYYEVPVKAAIMLMTGSITNVDFADMTALTDPIPYSFVTETTDPVLTYATSVGLNIPSILSGSGVFRLRRVIDPVFTEAPVVPTDNIIILLSSSQYPDSPVNFDFSAGDFAFEIITALGENVSIISITPPELDTISTVLPFTANAVPAVVEGTGSNSGDFTIVHTGANTPFIVHIDFL